MITLRLRKPSNVGGKGLWPAMLIDLVQIHPDFMLGNRWIATDMLRFILSLGLRLWFYTGFFEAMIVSGLQISLDRAQCDRRAALCHMHINSWRQFACKFLAGYFVSINLTLANFPPARMSVTTQKVYRYAWRLSDSTLPSLVMSCFIVRWQGRWKRWWGRRGLESPPGF